MDRGATLMRGPADLITTVGNRPGTLDVLGNDGEVRRLNVPNGRTTATWVGDLVAITTDSGVAFADATGRQKPPVRFVKLRGNPVISTFSPSGHRLYVALKKGTLVMIDRFTHERLRDLQLPEAADRMRVDRSGRWLLAHGANDSLWVIDLAKWVVTMTKVAAWADDLPQVVDGKTLLVRNHADVMAFDLDAPSPSQVGVLLGGAADLYIMLPWVPKTAAPTAVAAAAVRPAAAPESTTVPAQPPPALPPPSDAAAPPPAPSATGTIYLQVSSSQNQDWAQALAKQLKDGGFPARVLDPRNADEGYRVVIGPYATREDADAVGSRLGRPYFIVSPGYARHLTSPAIFAPLHARARRRDGPICSPTTPQAMKLTKLELSGFKSFADTVSLSFEEGVTAIVGPNGCGKSNVSDAVRWVLGEQSARLLRGGKMEDVIFQGAATRRPVNVTEVSLYLDNSDGQLPTPYTEVVITRRLSRSGQSDYLLNNSPARLRDIQDLLRGTGLGGDAGVVIEAKMIDLLLSDRAEERRSLFEEAAGVGLYRDRRHTTARRLEETAGDLQRLEDLIAEVQSQIRSLARQKGKTERHASLTEEKFAVTLTLARRRLEQLTEDAVAFELRHAELTDLLPKSREQLAAIEAVRETSAQRRHAAERHRAAVAEELGRVRVTIGKLEGDLAVAAERLANATDRRRRAAEERGESELRLQQAARELAMAGEESAAAETEHARVEQELAGRAKVEDDVRQSTGRAARAGPASRTRIAAGRRATALARR